MRIAAQPLQEFAAALLAASGASPANARLVAEALVRADLQGHESHGIMRVPVYLGKIRAGQLQPQAEPQVSRRHGATCVVDGGWGFGQVAARLGAEELARLAGAHGVGVVALERTNHVGRLADYAEVLADAGCFALVLAAGADRGGAVAPFGAAARLLGTNPLAWAAPVPAGRGALVADFSTAAIPAGKIAAARAHHQPVPPGCLVDRHGRPTTDPADFAAGGALLAFGGHKGSSLALFIELFASLLAGSAPASSPDYQYGNPTVMLAVQAAAFRDRPDLDRETGGLLERWKSLPPAEGFAAVQLPNETELRLQAERRRDGVPLAGAVWSELAALAQAHGLVPPPATP